MPSCTAAELHTQAAQKGFHLAGPYEFDKINDIFQSAAAQQALA